jgi:hypothetical protein
MVIVVGVYNLFIICLSCWAAHAFACEEIVVQFDDDKET